MPSTSIAGERPLPPRYVRATEVIDNGRQFAELAEIPRARLQLMRDQYILLPWSIKHVRLPKGERLNFETHPYLLDVYRDLSVESCALKGAQLGFSTKAIAKALWVAVELGRNVMYTFPTAQDVSSFTGARINPIIRNSAHLSDRILKIDNVGQKQFSPHSASERESMEERAAVALARGDIELAEQIRAKISTATIYFRGTGLGTLTAGTRKGEREAMAADADVLLHDELDRSEPRTLDQYGARIAHSTLQWRDTLSTPKFPGGPIDLQWQRSDQHVWMVRCSGCRRRFELRFPGQPIQAGETRYHNIDPEPEAWQPGLPARYRCHHCGKTISDLDRLAGEWVPMRSTRGAIRGWRISQMSYVGMTAAAILKAHDNYKNEADFWNLVMAVPYAGLTDNLNAEMIAAAQVGPLGGYPMSYLPDPNSVHTMGVDVGAKLYIVIRRPHPVLPGRRATVWLEEVEDWSRLSELMYHFSVGTCVIDAHPEDRLAEAFAAAHRGRVFRSYYTNRSVSSAADAIEWDPAFNEYDGSWSVKCDRTTVLDLARDRFAKGQVGMPATNELVTRFVEHCGHVFRVAEYAQSALGTDTTIVKRYAWVENGADHFRHADAYEMLASMRVSPMTVAGPRATTTILGAKTRGIL